jgi:hypothetical protein
MLFLGAERQNGDPMGAILRLQRWIVVLETEGRRGHAVNASCL